jgi:hypothetical protein
MAQRNRLEGRRVGSRDLGPQDHRFAIIQLSLDRPALATTPDTGAVRRPAARARAATCGGCEWNPSPRPTDPAPD